MPEIFDSEDLKRDSSQADSSSSSDQESSSKKEKKRKHHHRHVDEYSEVMRNERSHDGPFAAYMPKPRRLRFSTQNQDESIILMLRQHPVTQIKWIAIAIVMVFLPSLFISVGFFDFLPGRFYLAALVGWYLLIIGFSLESLLKWLYNVYIVTDERIIDVDFHSLLHRNISSAKTENIEDVTARTTGILATIFDYGNVEIQTAAEQREFEFLGVPHPNRVTTLINELILEEEREQIEGRVN